MIVTEFHDLLQFKMRSIDHIGNKKFTNDNFTNGKAFYRQSANDAGKEPTANGTT